MAIRISNLNESRGKLQITNIPPDPSTDPSTPVTPGDEFEPLTVPDYENFYEWQYLNELTIGQTLTEPNGKSVFEFKIDGTTIPIQDRETVALSLSTETEGDIVIITGQFKIYGVWIHELVNRSRYFSRDIWNELFEGEWSLNFQTQGTNLQMDIILEDQDGDTYYLVNNAQNTKLNVFLEPQDEDQYDTMNIVFKQTVPLSDFDQTEENIYPWIYPADITLNELKFNITELIRFQEKFDQGNIQSVQVWYRPHPTPFPLPTTVSNLEVSVSGSNATLNWDAPRIEIDGYNVYLLVNEVFTLQNQSILQDTTYTLENLDDGAYEAYVRVVIDGVEYDEEVTNFIFIGIEPDVSTADDFESYATGSVADNFINDLSNGFGWFITDSQSNGGLQSFASDADQFDQHNTTATTNYNFSSPIPFELSFDYFCSSENSPSSNPAWDFFRFSVNGTQVFKDASETWLTHIQEFEPGNYEFRFEYRKDGSVTGGEDRAWIDNFAINNNIVVEGPKAPTPENFTVTAPLSASIDKQEVLFEWDEVDADTYELYLRGGRDFRQRIREDITAPSASLELYGHTNYSAYVVAVSSSISSDPSNIVEFGVPIADPKLVSYTAFLNTDETGIEVYSNYFVVERSLRTLREELEGTIPISDAASFNVKKVGISNGNIVVGLGNSGNSNYTLRIYGSDGTILHETSDTISGISTPFYDNQDYRRFEDGIKTDNNGNLYIGFYLGSSTAPIIRKYSPTLDLLQDWTVNRTGTGRLAINPDETQGGVVFSRQEAATFTGSNRWRVGYGAANGDTWIKDSWANDYEPTIQHGSTLDPRIGFPGDNVVIQKVGFSEGFVILDKSDGSIIDWSLDEGLHNSNRYARKPGTNILVGSRLNVIKFEPLEIIDGVENLGSDQFSSEIIFISDDFMLASPGGSNDRHVFSREILDNGLYGDHIATNPIIGNPINSNGIVRGTHATYRTTTPINWTL